MRTFRLSVQAEDTLVDIIAWFRNTPDCIFVLDFIHGSRDLEAIVNELSC